MRCPRVAARHCHSRAAWASACRHYDRRARCIAGSAQATPGNARWLSHEAWPRLSLGMNSPIGTEPWWDAERRARSALRAPHPKGAEVGYASVGVPLPCFLPFLHSWLEAQIVRIPASTAGILWRRSVRRAEKFSSRDDDSGADRIARTRLLFHLSPRAGRGRASEAREGEGALPRILSFAATLTLAGTPPHPTLSPHAGRGSAMHRENGKCHYWPLPHCDIGG